MSLINMELVDAPESLDGCASSVNNSDEGVSS